MTDDQQTLGRRATSGGNNSKQLPATMQQGETIGVSLAQQAYVQGDIDLATLERALEDRLNGPSFSHDSRIDGHVPQSCRGDGYEPHAY